MLLYLARACTEQSGEELMLAGGDICTTTRVGGSLVSSFQGLSLHGGGGQQLLWGLEECGEILSLFGGLKSLWEPGCK